MEMQSNKRDTTIHYVSQRGDSYSRQTGQETNSKYSKKTSERIAPIVKQAVSDEDFSKILGGAMYLKGTTGEVYSEASEH